MEWREICLATAFVGLSKDERTTNESLSEFYEYKFDGDSSFLPRFGGKFLARSEDEFVHNTMQLYEDYPLWQASIEAGKSIINQKMTFAVNRKVLSVKLLEKLVSLQQSRADNSAMQAAWEETIAAREERSRQIFYKERLRNAG